jgi:hypothetical protein
MKAPQGNAPAALFWLACLLLSAILVLPFLLHQYPGMPDYPNHLARVQLIVDERLRSVAHPYYELRHALVPNLGLDMLVPLAVRAGLSTETGLKVFAVVAMLMPLAGVIAIGHVLQRGVPWFALLAFPLAYSRYFAWGFLNYFFAVGLAFCAFALWLNWRGRRPLAAAALLAAAGAVTMTAHLMGFAVLGLLVSTREAWLAWRARRIDWPAQWPAFAALLACTVFYLTAFERGLPLQVAWHDNVAGKLRNLLSPVVGYGAVPGVVTGVALVALCAVFYRRRRLLMQPGWLFVAAVFLLIYLALPSEIMGSYYAASRLLIIPALLFFAFATLPGGPRAQLTVVTAAFAITAVKTLDVHTHWERSSAQTAELRAALLSLPDAALVATAIEAVSHNRIELYPLRHVASFAVIDRRSFIPNFFGFPFNGESVAFKGEAAALTSRVDKDHLIYDDDDDPPPWGLWCSRFDAVLVMGEGKAVTPPPCVRPLRRGADWVLWQIDRDRSAALSAAPR